VLGHEIPEPHRQDRTTREVVWLAVHAVVGPACLIAVGATLSAAMAIVRLRTAENGLSVTLNLSLAIVALTAIGVAAVPLLHTLQARLAERLLGPASSLAGRVRALTESRAAAVDAQAAEVRRIERDLHDGAQARLISMRMNLGLAKSASDPDQVRELVREAWESAGQALVDLRDLVRGIHPPVLADRGLAGAIQAAALLCPIPVRVDIDLPARPEPPVESAVYFAAAEALTNVAKHSAATRAWVRLHHSGGVLRLAVGDDGHGGAHPSAGTGLGGIRRRLSAFDGTLIVHSPPGGPTELTMELPCALSSPKISHS
jgi:signal transduction histidine kinase